MSRSGPCFDENSNYSEKIKFFVKIHIFFWKIIFFSKIHIFLKNHFFFSKIQIFVKNWNFHQKSEFLWKIGIFVKSYFVVKNFPQSVVFGQKMFIFLTSSKLGQLWVISGPRLHEITFYWLMISIVKYIYTLNSRDTLLYN